AEQFQGSFDVPVDNVFGSPILQHVFQQDRATKYVINRNVFGSPILLEDMLQLNLDNPIVVIQIQLQHVFQQDRATKYVPVDN
ncbi:hypothetical protein PSZ83_24230, partial [Shigella sonnei]|nr:hypothetical protein [Shigella sonnei]